MSENSVITETIELKPSNGDISLELFYKDGAFRPNFVTKYFLDAIDRRGINEGEIAFDIGAGTAPIAIYLAKKGAQVYAVEPAGVNCELARENIKKYNLEDKINFLQGKYFDPLDDLKADLIVADVSGIARVPAKVLCWYSDQVPCAGEDGTDIICEMLKRAPEYSKEHTQVIFPVATDLSAGEKIIETANQYFSKVENALWSKEDGIRTKREERFHPQYLWFQLRDEEVSKIQEGYNGEMPNFISLQEILGRKFWRGQILVASEPR